MTRLCDLSVEGDSVTSVGWSERVSALSGGRGRGDGPRADPEPPACPPAPQGNLVAVGTHKGFVQIWDAAAGKKLAVLEGHTARVGERAGRHGRGRGAAGGAQGLTLPSAGALAWNADQLSSGSRDRMILQRDIRSPPLQAERRLQGHRQEVCGLKWSTDHQLLASGGNDNKVPEFP